MLPTPHPPLLPRARDPRPAAPSVRPLLAALACLVLLAAGCGGSSAAGSSDQLAGILHGDFRSHCIWLTTDHGRVEIVPPHGWAPKFQQHKVALYHDGQLVAVDGQRVTGQDRGKHVGVPRCPLHKGHTVRSIGPFQPVAPVRVTTS